MPARGVSRVKKRGAGTAEAARKLAADPAAPVMAGFTQKELIALTMDFKKIAMDNPKSLLDGRGADKITKEEFVKVFSRRTKIVVADARRLFDQADVNKDAILDFGEFVCLMAIIRKDPGEKKLELAFKMFDTDPCNGRLNSGEIRTMLQLMLTIEDERTKDAKIETVVARLIAAADQGDRDGLITLEELTAALKSETVGHLLLGDGADGQNLLDTSFGQNLRFEQISAAALESGLSKKKPKSAMCVVC